MFYAWDTDLANLTLCCGELFNEREYYSALVYQTVYTAILVYLGEIIEANYPDLRTAILQIPASSGYS
jgi:hypothetical protein